MASIQFLQIAANILFRFFIDVSMTLLIGLNPQTIPLRSLSLLVGCVILAVGISIEVAPDVSNLELYYNHQRVSLEELYEKAMSKSRGKRSSA